MRRRSALDLDDRQAMLAFAAALALPRWRARPGYRTGPVWQYWHAGPDRAPDLVRRCTDSVARAFGDRPVVLLDDRSLAGLVALPPWVTERREAIGPTHYSDILRCALLAEHGGTWIDATVLMTGPPPAWVDGAPFFAFTRPGDPHLFSSWYLRAQPGHPIVVALRDMLFDYWRVSSVQRHYFQLHAMFEAAVTLHRSLRRRWVASPHADFGPPHALQEALAHPDDAAQVAAARAGSWVHKLTWKVPLGPAGTGDGLEQLLAG
jgi:hypothetical protein